MNASPSNTTIFATATFILIVDSKALRNGSQSHVHLIEHIIDRDRFEHPLPALQSASDDHQREVRSKEDGSHATDRSHTSSNALHTSSKSRHRIGIYALVSFWFAVQPLHGFLPHMIASLDQLHHSSTLIAAYPFLFRRHIHQHLHRWILRAYPIMILILAYAASL